VDPTTTIPDPELQAAATTDAAAAEPELKIEFEWRNRRYPLPVVYRLVDPVLVEELTGVNWLRFCEAIDDPEQGLEDPKVLLGMLAVAIWQANPTLRRDRVVRICAGITFDDVKVIGLEPELAEIEAEREGDVDPPARTADSRSEEASSTPPETSATSQATTPAP
jgi:hypothetical protein